MTPIHPPATAAPVPQAERIQTLDIVRGFALFGILTVNMYLFSHPFQNYLLPPVELPWYDRAVQLLILALSEGKFYPLFSLLFGLGFAIQLERVRQRGGPLVPLHLRRLAILLVIGLLHATLIWIGDILTLYALLGMLLLLFMRVTRPRTLLVWAIGFWVVLQLATFALTGLIEWGRSIPEVATSIDASFAQQEALFRSEREQALAAYGSGTFGEVTNQRIRDLATISLGALAMAPMVMAMFLIGTYIGRRGLLREPATCWQHPSAAIPQQVHLSSLVSLCLKSPAPLASASAANHHKHDPDLEPQ